MSEPGDQGCQAAAPETITASPRDVIGASLRFPINPRDVPPVKAARRLHLTLAEFEAKLPELLARGFPRPDPTTGMYDLKAIDAWQDARSGLAGGLTDERKAVNAEDVFEERVRALHGQG